MIIDPGYVITSLANGRETLSYGGLASYSPESILLILSIHNRWVLFGMSTNVNFQFTPKVVMNEYMVLQMLLLLMLIDPNMKLVRICKITTTTTTTKTKQNKTKTKTKQKQNKTKQKQNKTKQKQNKTKQKQTNKKKKNRLLCSSHFAPNLKYLKTIMFGNFYSWWNHQMRFTVVHSTVKNTKSSI